MLLVLYRCINYNLHTPLHLQIKLKHVSNSADSSCNKFQTGAIHSYSDNILISSTLKDCLQVMLKACNNSSYYILASNLELKCNVIT